MLKEHPRRQQRGHKASHALHGLRQIEPNLRIPRRSTDGQERIGRRLQRRQAGANDEHAPAEAAEGALHARGPEEEAPDGEDEEATHEGDAEAVAAQDPAREGEGAEEVGAEVGGGEAGGFGGGDVELLLEVAVEDVEEAVGEAPEKEEDCYLGGLVWRRYWGGGEEGVPRRLGMMDWRRVRFAADVTVWSSTTILRLKMPLSLCLAAPIVAA